MKISKTLILLLLVMSMLLSACGAASAENPEQTLAAVEENLEMTEETESVAEEVPASDLPEEDVATGKLLLYLNDQKVYAGAPVSDLLAQSAHSYTDMTQLIQPKHMSEPIRIQVELPDVEAKDEPYVFFVAMNPGDEPKMISECVIYSLAVNYEENIRFGSGQEKEAFVTGVTTQEELVKAYGEPSYIDSRKEKYQELFYYQPFNCVSFMCKGGVVMQINSYYSADLYGSLADNLKLELTGTPMEKDAIILMSQYLDMTDYLPEEIVKQEEKEDEKKETNKEEEKKEEEKQEEQEEQKKSSLTSFDDSFQIDGNTIKFGSMVSELPSPFKEDLSELKMPISRNFYIRTGRHDPEEFFLINSEGQIDSMSDKLVVKGVVVENENYVNWGTDNSAFHSFNCQGITENSTIEDVLNLLGQPGEIIFSSGERVCFAWMHYENEAGDYIHVRVDPLLNQVIEVHMVKYFEKEREY